MEIADLSVNKFKENRIEEEDEYSLEAVVKKPRIEISDPTSSSRSSKRSSFLLVTSQANLQVKLGCETELSLFARRQ